MPEYKTYLNSAPLVDLAVGLSLYEAPQISHTYSLTILVPLPLKLLARL